ncbi:unnamed protein product, partial [marine sediment metagenome]
ALSSLTDLAQSRTRGPFANGSFHGTTKSIIIQALLL